MKNSSRQIKWGDVSISLLYGKSYRNPRNIQSPPLVPVRKLCLSRGIFFPAGGYESGLLDELLSWPYLHSAWDIKCPTAGAKMVLIALADHADKEGYCYPSFERLAKRCCMSRRSIINHIQALEKLNIIRVARNFKQANRYQLLLKVGECNGFTRVVKKTTKGSETVAPKPSRTINNRMPCRWLLGEAPKSKATEEEIETLKAALRNSVA